MFWHGIPIAEATKSTGTNGVVSARDSTITHPRSSKIQDPEDISGLHRSISRTDSTGKDALILDDIRSRSGTSDHSGSDRSRSSSSSSTASGKFNWFSNASTHSSDDEDEEIKARKSKYCKLINVYFIDF